MTLEQRIRQACNPISGLTDTEYDRHVKAVVAIAWRAKQRRRLARAGVGDQAITGTASLSRPGEPVRPPA